MLRRLSHLALAVAAALSSPLAQASVGQVRVTLDAAKLQSGLPLTFAAGSGMPLSVGDSLVVDIGFLPGQVVRLDQPMSFSLLTGSQDLKTSIDMTLRNSLTLNGADGTMAVSAGITQVTHGNALQSLFFASQLVLRARERSSLRLSGLSFDMTVMSYGDHASEHVFGGSMLTLVAGGVSVIATPVPEPSRLVLALLGVGLLGLWSARRR